MDLIKENLVYIYTSKLAKEKWAKNLYIASICYGRTVSWTARLLLGWNLRFLDLSLVWPMKPALNIHCSLLGTKDPLKANLPIMAFWSRCMLNSSILPTSHSISYKHQCTVFQLCQNAYEANFKSYTSTWDGGLTYH